MRKISTQLLSHTAASRGEGTGLPDRYGDVAAARSVAIAAA